MIHNYLVFVIIGFVIGWIVGWMMRGEENRRYHARCQVAFCMTGAPACDTGSIAVDGEACVVT